MGKRKIDPVQSKSAGAAGMKMERWLGYAVLDEDVLAVAEIALRKKNKAAVAEHGDDAFLTTANKDKRIRGALCRGRVWPGENGKPGKQSYMIAPCLDEKNVDLGRGVYLKNHWRLDAGLEDLMDGTVVEFEVTKITEETNKKTKQPYNDYHYDISVDFDDETKKDVVWMADGGEAFIDDEADLPF